MSRFLIAAGENPREFAKELNGIPAGYSAYTPVCDREGVLYQIFELRTEEAPAPPAGRTLLRVAVAEHLYTADAYQWVIEQNLDTCNRVELRTLFGVTTYLVDLGITDGHRFVTYRAEERGEEIAQWSVATVDRLARLLRDGHERAIVGKISPVDVEGFLRTGLVSSPMVFLQEEYGVKFRRERCGGVDKIRAASLHEPSEVYERGKNVKSQPV